MKISSLAFRRSVPKSILAAAVTAGLHVTPAHGGDVCPCLGDLSETVRSTAPISL
ncbi:MAG: hypothetical protein SGJ11_05050 [Phycisphaerae bacterium]|nr:hypothetical protein [Phycisphaerae bacterium]